MFDHQLRWPVPGRLPERGRAAGETGKVGGDLDSRAAPADVGCRRTTAVPASFVEQRRSHRCRWQSPPRCRACPCGAEAHCAVPAGICAERRSGISPGTGACACAGMLSVGGEAQAAPRTASSSVQGSAAIRVVGKAILSPLDPGSRCRWCAKRHHQLELQLAATLGHHPPR